MDQFFNKVDEDKSKCDTNKNENQCDVGNSVSSDTPKGSEMQLTDLRDRVKMLKYWSEEYRVDVLTKREDETLLLMCLRSDQSDSCIMQLIEIECDVNATNGYGKSPLHLAIKRPTLMVALELIKKGANINAQDNKKFTSLHFAVRHNHEAVCMLLYYGADVYVRCCDMFSPLGKAIYYGMFDSIQTLMDYHEDKDLYEEIDFFMYFDRNPLKLIVELKDSRLFKLAWSYINHDTLAELDSRCQSPYLDFCTPFLFIYIHFCNFPTNEWFECLQLILQSDSIIDLMENFNEYFFGDLVRELYLKQIEINKRMSIIFTVLSLGTKIHCYELNIVYKFYGFGAELEALIYAADYEDIYNSHSFSFMLLSFILCLSNDISTKTIVSLLKKQIGSNPYIKSDMKQNHLASALRFFSFNSNVKAELLKISSRPDRDNSHLKKILDEVRELPSLLELSRNQIYLSIRNSNKIKKPYHFYDAVKNLLLPQNLKDVIIFKTPIY